jgi:hypothetical protein
MAQAEENSGNWIWWTLGGVALLGLGVGSYFFFRGKNGDKKNKSDANTPPQTTIIQKEVIYRDRPTSTTTTSSSGNPFTSKNDLEKFQQWVKNNKSKEYNIGKVDGKWGSKSSGAWAKYGQEYQATLQVSQGQPTSWSSTDYTANTELKNLLVSNGQDVDREVNSFEWDTTNKYPTVFVKFYDGGILTLEKKESLAKSRYAKTSGSWRKIVDGCEFNYGNKTYKSKYDGLDLTNVLYGLMKDANYFSWSDGSFVAFSPSNDDMDIFSMNGGEIILGGGSTSSVQDSIL